MLNQGNIPKILNIHNAVKHLMIHGFLLKKKPVLKLSQTIRNISRTKSWKFLRNFTNPPNDKTSNLPVSANNKLLFQKILYTPQNYKVISSQKLSGLNLLQKLYHDTKTSFIPIAIITFLTKTQDTMRTFKPCHDDFIFQPFNQHEVINNLLNRNVPKVNKR